MKGRDTAAGLVPLFWLWLIFWCKFPLLSPCRTSSRFPSSVFVFVSHPITPNDAGICVAVIVDNNVSNNNNNIIIIIINSSEGYFDSRGALFSPFRHWIHHSLQKPSHPHSHSPMLSPSLQFVVAIKAHPDDVVHLHGHGHHLSKLLPAAMRLPIEILHQIYSLLDPPDFNVARHTCRTWFWAGLNRSILVTMLKRGGWWSSIESVLDVKQGKHALFNVHDPDVTEEWVMSKWLARECALGPSHGALEPAFVEISQTQFTDFASATVPGTGEDACARYTASMCGQFLMVSYGAIIYVYELNHRCRDAKSPRWSMSS
ncbi:hypothetical protein CTA2_11510 [Colletotrichum tanaceti]|uniref:F-box domain-containing protein n=1 Tax=Colletotrichum tanaceti TaxID=1306861 RepID=A0A4U6X7L2_9PEZI|nr:hypothetical protein CTA2_11510 [Colletotrichum tanaceti]TKW51124.1 hypothetical protein CTA1_2775 [Colletotrichum tanaceti]